jgi:hypothetical protein
MPTSNDHAVKDSRAERTLKADSEYLDPVAKLIKQFGELMPSVLVAAELGYSHNYFIKKIGSQDYEHLDWVIALKPARVRKGRALQYKTAAVAGFMKQRGLL